MKTKTNNLFKKCIKCEETLATSTFAATQNTDFYKDNLSPVCNNCIQDILIKNDFSWESVNKICQMLDIPFVPKEWERLRSAQGMGAFPYYARIFQEDEFEGLDWQAYDERFRELQKAKVIERELPEINNKRIQRLRNTWGGEYTEEELEYLENLYNGVLATQSVTGALQMDQGRKVCKMSLSIDRLIEAGEDPSKMTRAYDRVVKMANFTAENVKDANDFSSFGEAFAWLERRGWVNKFYEGESKDIVDGVLDSLETFNRRLYTEESSMGDQITDRINALKSAASTINDPSQAINHDPYDMTKIIEDLDIINIMGDDDDDTTTDD